MTPSKIQTFDIIEETVLNAGPFLAIIARLPPKLKKVVDNNYNQRCSDWLATNHYWPIISDWWWAGGHNKGRSEVPIWRPNDLSDLSDL